MINIGFLALWALVALVQNAAFTLVSRARNSGSLMYNGLASTASNGIWFGMQFLVIASISEVTKDASLWLGIGLGAWYVLWTTLGSVGMQYIAMRHIETKRGRRGTD